MSGEIKKISNEPLRRSLTNPPSFADRQYKKAMSETEDVFVDLLEEAPSKTNIKELSDFGLNKRRISFLDSPSRLLSLKTDNPIKRDRLRSDSIWSRQTIDEDGVRVRLDTSASVWSRRGSLCHNTKEVAPNEKHYALHSNDYHPIPSLKKLHLSVSTHTITSMVADVTDSADFLKPKFGWVKGVLARCLLNIWGVMIFLRVPWCVGHAGVLKMVIIVLISAFVTLITTLSLSAICTNGYVQNGGAYFLISRSLGPEIGGAIGLVFSFANAVGVAMYVVGFAETVRDVLHEHDFVSLASFGDGVWDVRIIGVVTCIVILAISLISLSLVIKVQLALLFLLIIALMDFAIGSFSTPSEIQWGQGFRGYQTSLFVQNLFSDQRSKESFFSVFAVFFPAATGVLAGANISGDLRNASEAIPKGTLLAIAISTVVYVILAIICGATVTRYASGSLNSTMIDCVPNCQYGLNSITSQAMSMVSLTGYILLFGIFAASLSSAIASLVGAPKVFQAVCQDKIFPFVQYFEKGSKKDGEPRRGYILATCIAVVFVAFGKLNLIAPLISNFFLICYALINGACFLASITRSPGWRPTFRFYNEWLSLGGFIACTFIMFLIDYLMALITFLTIAALFAYIRHRELDINWGTFTQSFAFVSTLEQSIRLQNVPKHVKTFRPQCLVLTGVPSNRPSLVGFVSSFTKRSSLMICGNILPDEPRFICQEEDESARNWLHFNRYRAFYSSICALSFKDGARALLQTAGLGKFRPNTLVIGYKNNWQTDERWNVVEYVETIHSSFDLNCGVCILRMPKGLDLTAGNKGEIQHTWFSNYQSTIDIWWLYDDGGLTLLIPHLLTLNKRWANTKIRVFLSGSRSKIEEEKNEILKLLEKFRIKVTDINIIPELKGLSSTSIRNEFSEMREQFVSSTGSFHPTTIPKEEITDLEDACNRQIRIGEIVRRHSLTASLVVISLPVPVVGTCSPFHYMCWLETISKDLPPTLLIRGNQENVLTFYL